MNLIQGLRLRSKLMAMIILPILGMLYFSQAWVVEQFGRLDDMRKLTEMSTIVSEASSLLYASQAERRATALSMANAGNAGDLDTTRTGTDIAAGNLLSEIKSYTSDSSTDEFSISLNAIRNSLSGLTATRDKAGTGKGVVEVLVFYRDLNSRILELARHLPEGSNDSGASARALSYVTILSMEEQADFESDIIDYVVSGGELSRHMQDKLKECITAQAVYKDLFLSFSTDAQRRAFDSSIKDGWTWEIEAIRDALSAGDANNLPQIDPSKWRSVSSKRAQALKSLRDRGLAAVENHVQRLKDQARNALVIDFSITSIALLAVIIFSVLITKNILGQLGGEPAKIVETSKKIAGGDLSVSLDSIGTEGSLYDEMRKMSGNLSTDIGKILEAAEKLQTCSADIKSSMKNLSEGAMGQLLVAEQVATATDEMSQTVMDIAQNASEIANAAADTMGVANDGADIVRQTIDEVQEISITVTESSELMTSLGERSNQIGEIVGVINEIADQTNLLALNAAIEAARAGEQGRGFAVVADEVRKLAERTSKATGTISEMIGAIQSETARAVASMKESIEKVELGTALSGQAGDGLRKIVEKVKNLQQRVQHIAAATEEMSTTSEMISSDISSIVKTSESTNTGADKTKEESVYLAGLADELREITRHFKL